MYTERSKERHALGLVRLTGSNRGLYYANERTEKQQDPETGKTVKYYVYDVYQVDDARNPGKVKNDVVTNAHPNGDEIKLLRKTLANLLLALGKNNDAEFAQFKQYNDFVNGVEV